MKNYSWIKMGFKVVKLIILVVLVGIMFYSNANTKRYSLLESYDFFEELGISAKATKNEEEKPKVEDVPDNGNNNVLGANQYNGDLTGYVAHCPDCYGTLACKTDYNVYKNGVVTYPDSTYGNVRIVASSKNLKCGSIIRFSVSSLSSEPIYAIVLDRGVLGTDIDLLVATEDEAIVNVGRKKITYDVLRAGW